MEYYFDEEKKIYILLASTVQDQEAFNQLALNPAITFAALNPNFLISSKAVVIAVHRLMKVKNFSNYSSSEFQRDLHYLLQPEDAKFDDKFLVKNISDPALYIFLRGYDPDKLLLIFKKEELPCLVHHADLNAIKAYYKISDAEANLDQGIQGAVYNSIVLKKLRK